MNWWRKRKAIVETPAEINVSLEVQILRMYQWTEAQRRNEQATTEGRG